MIDENKLRTAITTAADELERTGCGYENLVSGLYLAARLLDKQQQKEKEHMKHLVYIRHTSGGTLYVFESPVPLKNGTQVLCDTKHGKQPGVCAGDSVEVPEHLVEFVAKGAGGKVPLRRILGQYIFTAFGEVGDGE